MYVCMCVCVCMYVCIYIESDYLKNCLLIKSCPEKGGGIFHRNNITHVVSGYKRPHQGGKMSNPMKIDRITNYPTKFSAGPQWLRCCATNQKVAGSIPAGVIVIFH